MGFLRRLTVLGVLVGLVSVWVVSRPAATRDTFVYSTPPFPVFRLVVPAVQWFREAVVRLTTPPFVRSVDLALDAQLVFVLAPLVERNIPELLLEKRLSVRALAQATSSDPMVLYRLMRRASVSSYFRELPSSDPFAHPDDDLLAHEFENTPFSDALRADAVPSGRPGLLHMFHDIVPAMAHFGRLLSNPKENLFATTHKTGDDYWEYFTKNPERGSNFNKYMEALENGSGQGLASDFDYAAHCGECVIDYAGGKGRFLHTILKHHPSIEHAVLFDLPSVIEEARPVWQQSSFSNKTELVSGSFFEDTGVPLCARASSSCYVTRFILHDWNDEHCGKILAVLHRRMKANDTLVLGEFTPDSFCGSGTIAPKVDTVMLTFQGAERTVAQFNILLEKAGFGPVEVHRVRAFQKILISKKKN